MSLRHKRNHSGGSRSLRKLPSITNGGAINAGNNKAPLVRMAVGTLNQWAMDFKGNTDRIITSITDAHKQGALILALPELAVSGYSCQDHFLEREMFELSFMQLLEVKKATADRNILVAVGCPILHKEVRYNCTVFIYNGKIVLIRPKHNLADDGNYREARWFTAWTKTGLEKFNYMDIECDIGIGLLNFNGIIVGAEVCEELWVPDNLGAHMYLAGADVLINGSGSHFELGKQENKRKKLLENATRACGGIYLYSNLKGCDGERLYFDGGSLLAMNGKIVGETPTFTLDDVQVHYHDFNMNEITTYRMRSNSYQLKASHQVITEFPILILDINMRKIQKRKLGLVIKNDTNTGIHPNKSYYTPIKFGDDVLLTEAKMINDVDIKAVSEEEKEYREKMETVIPIANVEEVVAAAACWLWDYLRRSGTTGYMLPLSGGADSAATACIVYRMCEIIVANKDTDSVQQFCNNTKKNGVLLSALANKWSPNEWCGYILNSVYLPTKFSGTTRKYAADFAEEIGASHEVVNIDAIFRSSIRQVTRIDFKIIENDMKIKRGLIALGKRMDAVEKPSKKKLIYNSKINTALIAEIRKLIIDTIQLLGNDSSSIDSTYISNTEDKSKIEEHEAIVKKDKEIVKKLLSEYNDLQKFNDDFTFSNIKLSQWDLAIQNVQARTRMVMTYTVAQLKGRALLNLGSSNADEVYVGYYTKYDASSADVNPIGSLPKTYIQRILIVFGSKIKSIRAIVNSEPTAELTPGLAGIAQTDESDIGLLYTEMSELGRLMSNGYGPLDTYHKLISNAGEVFKGKTKEYINDKITLFNYRYRFHRHKAVILPPSVHLLSQTPDDNRYNLRPFLYPPFSNSWQPNNPDKQSLEKTLMDTK